MESHYRLNGHILALPIKGEGMSYGNYSKCEKKIKLRYIYTVALKSDSFSVLDVYFHSTRV